MLSPQPAASESGTGNTAHPPLSLGEEGKTGAALPSAPEENVLREEALEAW